MTQVTSFAAQLYMSRQVWLLSAIRSPHTSSDHRAGTPLGLSIFAAVVWSRIFLHSCADEVFSSLGKAYLGIEVGGGEVAAHSHPAWPDVVVLPKQLQPSPTCRTQPPSTAHVFSTSGVLHALCGSGACSIAWCVIITQ